MRKKDKTAAVFIISGILGGTAFFVLLFVFKTLAIGLVAGTALYLIAFFLLLKRGKKPLINSNLRYIKDKDLRSIVRDGQDKANEIKKLSLKIKNSEIRQKADEIVRLSAKIFDEFEKDPGNITASRQFFSYYFDAVAGIIRQYTALSAGADEKDITDICVRTDKILGQVKNSFEKHLLNLIKNDIMDLDVEISVLEKTLKTEGMI